MTVMTEPTTLDEIAGQSAFVTEAKRWAEQGEYPPAVLVHGPPGVGKTTVGKVLARVSLGEFFDPMNFIITNASDDRGIDFIRNELKQWATIKAMGADRRVILLDEADGLTPAAQDALRQIIELLSDNCFFILTANDISKIRPAIQSRCLVYEFKPISPEDGAKRLVELFKGHLSWIGDSATLSAWNNTFMRHAKRYRYHGESW
jgi:replication factor C small subunit